MTYTSPSALPRVNPTAFMQRKFGRVLVRALSRMNTRYVEFPRRSGFSVPRAERRTFEIYYGYNPRCAHQGTYGKPGHFHHFPAHYKDRCHR